LGAAHDAGVTDVPTRTVVVWREKNTVKREEFLPVSDAANVLDRLVRVARHGLAAPLPFFAKAAWAWHSTMHPKPKKPSKSKKASATVPEQAREGDPDEARWEARRCFERETTQFASGGDGEDVYVALCFRGVDPMTDRWDDFERLATTLFSAWRWTGADEE
jgi:exonuclease V gamma subunit